jgi:hypothetical protein
MALGKWQGERVIVMHSMRAWARSITAPVFRWIAAGLAPVSRLSAVGGCSVPDSPGWHACGNGLAAYPVGASPAVRPEFTIWEPERVPDAGAVARLGAPRLARGEGVDAADATPLYVRDRVALTVAERLAKRGQGVSAVLAPRRSTMLGRCACDDIDDMLAIEERSFTRFPGLAAISSIPSLPATACGDIESMANWSATACSCWRWMKHTCSTSVWPRNASGWGFGASLLNPCQAGRASGRSHAVSCSRCDPPNEKALALYRRFGFRQIGVRRAYYAAAQGREDALVLRLVSGLKCSA